MEEILTIIIADDNELIANIMKSNIEKEDKYRVIGIAKDEREEKALIDKLEPDLVITDLKKNEKWVGLEIIKEYQKKQNSPIFFVVSASVYSSINEIRKMDIRYYLNKPYRSKQLFEILNDIYDEKKTKSMVKVQNCINTNESRNIFKKILKLIREKYYNYLKRI